ncbi:MAG: hypothetical protein HYS34_09920 [Acidobacteria bacterium]|nr:hypothetical protein [Acidobacteriota bacterium]
MKPSRRSKRGKAGGGAAAPAPGDRAGSGPAPGNRRLRRDAVVIFLGLWLVYGATIDRTDVYDYALQQFVIASLVSKGTYAIGEAGDDRLKRITDTFVYEGKRLPAKQPGQFTIGALAYLACSPFGIAYSRDRILASALVTWLTSSLLSALAAACIYLMLAGAWGYPRGHSAVAAAASGLATILFPYSGVAHHDILAVSFLVMALYLIERSIRDGKPIVADGPPGAGGPMGAGDGRALVAPLVAGVLLGLTLFTSMLPGVIVAVLLARVVLSRNLKRAAALLGGLFLGLLPLLAYNTHYFGNPFLQANVAGGFTDTFFRPDSAGFLHHLNVYLGAGDLSLVKYMPILVLGGAGTFLLGSGLVEQKRMLWAAIALHVAYVLNIQTIGDCQYGPRYLIPIVPLAMLGLPALLAWGRTGGRAWPAAVTGVVTVYSAAVNLVGALVGTMFCDTRKFAFLEDLPSLAALAPAQFPLAPLCSGIALIAMVLGLVRARLARSGRWPS